VAVAACAGDRGAARRSFEDGGAAGRKVVRGKAQGIPPPHRGAMERAADKEEIKIGNEKNRR